MAKFTSKAVVLEGHQVSEAEGTLQATLERGIDTLHVGDALLTVKGKPYIVRAPLFEALFGKGKAEEAEEAEPAAGKAKGGQHTSSTK